MDSNPYTFKIEHLLNEMDNIAEYLYHNVELHKYTVLSNKVTILVYKTGKHYITIKRDANTRTYDIKVHLQKYSTVAGRITNEGVLASSEPDGSVPF